MKHSTIAFFWITFAVIASAMCALLFSHFLPASAPATGSASDNVMNTINTASGVYVGAFDSTLVSATNTARRYFKISNVATSSVGQVLYCNVNDKAAVVGSGFAVFASSSLEMMLDNMYTGAIRCKYATATSGITLIEQ